MAGAIATPNTAFFEDAWSWESVTGAAVATLAPWLAVAMTRGRLDLRADLSGLGAALDQLPFGDRMVPEPIASAATWRASSARRCRTGSGS